MLSIEPIWIFHIFYLEVLDDSDSEVTPNGLEEERAEVQKESHLPVAASIDDLLGVGCDGGYKGQRSV